MARLKHSGAVVLTAEISRKIDGAAGPRWTNKMDRIMSNGTILTRRPGGGYRKVGRLKKGLTFGDVKAIYQKHGWKVELEFMTPEVLEMLPWPKPRQGSRFNNGFLKALAAHRKRKAAAAAKEVA